jgi:hypothetical protein
LDSYCDHAGGLPPVLRRLGAGAFGDSGQTYPGHAYHDALDVLQRQRTPPSNRAAATCGAPMTA